MVLHSKSLSLWSFGWIAAGLLMASPVSAQVARPASAVQAPKAPGALFKAPQFRNLVPGVERTIDADRSFKELTSRHDVPELLSVDGTFDWAKDTQYYHDIWALDFTFKPMRMIEVDVPAPGGKLRKKLVWYLVYRVKNPGVVWHTEPTVYADPEAKVAKKDAGEFEYEVTGRDVLTEGKVTIVEEAREKPIRFVPNFVLFSRDADIGKQYLDRPLPAAQRPIQMREDVARALKNSAEMTMEIPASPEGQDRSVWGVATWEDVDPRTDFLSVYIQGLTNAYQRKWVEGKGWWYAQKTLRLDFTRPGDEYNEHEDEIRFIRSTWVYLDSNLASSPEDKDAAAPIPLSK